MEQDTAGEPPGLDRVVHVEPDKTWTDALVASVRASDSHVSDEEIFDILVARGEGQTAADLCAAKSVTIPMYCVWKAKYRGLNVEAIGQARRRELWRARGIVGVLLAVAVMGAGGIMFGLVRAAQATLATGRAPEAVDTTPSQAQGPSGGSRPATTTASQPADKGRETGAATPNPVASGRISAAKNTERVTSARTERHAGADRPLDTAAAPPSVTTAPRYNVQVTAAATLEEGRVLVDRLAAAGHPAYVSAAIVKDVEVFRVRVGPFEALEQAKEVSLELQRNGHPDAWIVR